RGRWRVCQRSFRPLSSLNGLLPGQPRSRQEGATENSMMEPYILFAALVAGQDPSLPPGPLLPGEPEVPFRMHLPPPRTGAVLERGDTVAGPGESKAGPFDPEIVPAVGEEVGDAPPSDLPPKELEDAAPPVVKFVPLTPAVPAPAEVAAVVSPD